MQRDRKLQNKAKILSTLLGRTPDSHGVLPDFEGWFSIKSVMQVLSEMPDLKDIREADIMDICREKDGPLEMEERMIRAKQRIFPDFPSPAARLPKILHICIREKAWPHVSEKGLRADESKVLILSSDPGLALRMGKRKGAKPVPLRIQVSKALQENVAFLSHGELLFCVGEIPVSAIMGPPLPKIQKKTKIPEALMEKVGNFMPGSFLLRSEEKRGKGKKRSRESWKDNKKRLRREQKFLKDE